MKRIAFIMSLLLSLLLVQGTFAQTGDNWTILHYTAVDNDLEAAAFNDYYEMQSIGSGDGVNIVAQLDRADGYDTRFGDWTGTRRFYIEHVDPLPDLDSDGMRDAVLDYLVESGAGDADTLRPQVDSATDAVISSIYTSTAGITFDQTPIEDLGEVDMGDPQALFDFIVWGVENYPANHYMIVIGSHGGGWRGIGPDEGDNASMLDLPEIDDALAQARAVLGIDKFDIVGFDACLMGVTDVAVMLEPHADYVLFSQEVIPSSGWEYVQPISAMRDNPDWDAFQVGASFVDTYMDYYAGPGARTKVGLSLVQTDQTPALLESLQYFAQVVEADPVALLSALGTARNNSQAFGTSLGDRADTYSYVDLRDFMIWFSLQTTISEDAFNAAQEVIAAFDAAVVYSRADDRLPRASGLAVYLPTTPVVYAAYGEQYPDYAPPAFAFWQNYLNQFYAAIVGALDGSALQIDIDTVFTFTGVGSVIDNPVVSFNAAGLGVIDLSYTITYLQDDGTRIIVDTYPIAYTATLPTGEQIIEYPNELTPSYFVWGVEVPILSDGTNSVLGLAQSSSSSGGEAFIQGTYVTATGDAPAYLVFDTTTLTYTGMLAVVEDSPAEVQPSIGDQFIVDLITISPEGETAVIPLTDAPLTFGVQPFTLTYQPAQSGMYEIGLSMSDLAGNRIYRSAEVTVDNEQVDGAVRGYTDISDGVYFQYPREWGDSKTLANDDGSITTMVSSQSGDHAIFVDVYADTDVETALYAVMDAYPVEYGEVSEITFAGLPALYVEFAAASDSGTIVGALVCAFNEATNSAVLLTVQSALTANDLLNLLDQTFMLFEPLSQ